MPQRRSSRETKVHSVRLESAGRNMACEIRISVARSQSDGTARGSIRLGTALVAFGPPGAQQEDLARLAVRSGLLLHVVEIGAVPVHQPVEQLPGVIAD